MSMITVSVELPEGVSVDTRRYRAAHGTQPPNAFGTWLFDRLDADEEFTHGGMLVDALDLLPDGEWVLLP